MRPSPGTGGTGAPVPDFIRFLVPVPVVRQDVVRQDVVRQEVAWKGAPALTAACPLLVVVLLTVVPLGDLLPLGDLFPRSSKPPRADPAAEISGPAPAGPMALGVLLLEASLEVP